jgi:hypothetical protein
MNERAGSVPPAYSASGAASRARPAVRRRAPSSARESEPPAPPGPRVAGLAPRAPDPVGKPPSWASVIVTTVQLWLQRRVIGGPDAAAGRRAVARRMVVAFGVAIVVFAAGALTIALALGRGSHDATKASRSSHAVKAAASGALRQAARNRATAATWAATQLSRGAIVSCDPVMCAALQRAGFPAGNLLTLGPAATDPMGSQVVAATTVLRSQLGSHLVSVYAPVVIASFGTGATRVDIRVEAPDGSPAYLAGQRADMLARRDSGRQLLRNKNLHVTGPARQAIAAGHVDARLLITLAALTTRHAVYIDGFGDHDPGAAAEVPVRTMRLAALTRRGRPGKRGYLLSVVGFLRAQQAPFRPAVTVVHEPGSKTAIQIEFPAPSPLGLLGRRTSP